MRVAVPIAEGSGPTGRLIQSMLEERGIEVVSMNSARAEAIISYGVRTTASSLPTLNGGGGGSNKYVQLQTLAAAGVRTPRFGNRNEAGRFNFPLLARRANHRGGTDIAITMQPEDIPVRCQQGADFFTEFIPVQNEYRVWIYRRRHLGTYEKFLAYPEKFKRVGRNYQNGFAFRIVTAENLPRPAIDMASAAVEALKLDFGAVDVLQGKDGQFYVLEVNTAPGVEGENRQVIQSLVDKFVKWTTLGMPKRKGS